MSIGFQFNTSPQIIIENGSAGLLTQKANCFLSGLKNKNVVIISDPLLVSLGMADPVVSALEKAGYKAHIFDEVVADPPDNIVLRAIETARSKDAAVIIGLGGGSPMDVAKLTALLAHPECKQSLPEIYGVDKVKGSKLPLIQIPTTAGTGSEVTPVAIITTGENTKSGVVSSTLIADTVILDASLTIKLPPGITAATGIDAMVHAIEAFTSKIRKNPLSDMLAQQALRLLANNIRTACNDGKNLGARSNMLIGAMLAGQAFANAPVAAVHALAYPLGGRYHIPHGESNALVLCEVMKFNESHCSDQYAELAPCIFSELSTLPSNKRVDGLLDQLGKLVQDILPKTRLSDYSINEEELSQLAKDAMLQTRLLVNNPRDVKEQDALNIYRAVF